MAPGRARKRACSIPAVSAEVDWSSRPKNLPPALAAYDSAEYVVEDDIDVAVLRNDLERVLAMDQIKQRTDEWLEARKTMITASEIGCLTKQNPYMTEKKLSEKKRNALMGIESPASEFMLTAMRHGTLFEPVVGELYLLITGTQKLHETGLVRHPTEPHVGASPDGISDHGVLVEFKVPAARRLKFEIPSYYLAQMQLQMEVCGIPVCHYLEVRIIEEMCMETMMFFRGQGNVLGGCFTVKDGEADEISPLLIDDDGLKAWRWAREGVRFFTIRQFWLRSVHRDAAWWRTTLPLVRAFVDKTFADA